MPTSAGFLGYEVTASPGMTGGIAAGLQRRVNALFVAAASVDVDSACREMVILRPPCTDSRRSDNEMDEL